MREKAFKFFDRMAVDLLIKVGYPYDDKSGQVIGKSHDGWIDGIIREDNLVLFKYKQKDIQKVITQGDMKFRLSLGR